MGKDNNIIYLQEMYEMYDLEKQIKKHMIILQCKKCCNREI